MSDIYLKDPRANTYEGWIAALTIFAKYEEKGLQARMDKAAEHDILYLPSKPEPKSAEHKDGDTVLTWNSEQEREDGESLERLGFHWCRDVDCWAKFT